MTDGVAPESRSVLPEFRTLRQRRIAAALAVSIPILVHAFLTLWAPGRFHGCDFESLYRCRGTWAREAFQRDGALPLWSSAQYGGTPELGCFQGAEPIFYPPNWLWLWMSPEAAYRTLVMLHLLLAGAGMYRLMREWSVSRCGAVLAALSYAIGFMMSALIKMGMFGALMGISWAPAVLFLLVRLLRRSSWRDVLRLAAALALLILSGLPVYIYHLGLVSAAIVGWSVCCRIRERRPWRLPLLQCSAAAALALLLSAGFLLPAFEVAYHSTRVPGGDIYQGAGPPRHHAFVLQNFIYFGIPWFSGTSEGARLQGRDYWYEKSVYIGILPIILAVLGLTGRRRREAILFAVIGLVAMLDAMACDLPVHSALTAILPAYGSFRLPGRIVWVGVLCLSVLSGFGWDAFRSSGIPLRRLAILVSVLALPVAAVAAFYLRAPRDAFLFGLSTVLSLAVFRLNRAAPAAAVALTSALLLGYGVAIQDRREEPSPEKWYVSKIDKDYRVLNLASPDLADTLHGVRILQGFGYPIVSGMAEYYSRAWKDRPPLQPDALGIGAEIARPEILSRLNVRWIVATRPLHPSWIERARSGPEVLYENPDALGSAFLLEGGSATVERRTNRIRVDSRAPQPSRLVVSESWMPGWNATINGARATVSRYEGALLQLEVPAGESRIELSYFPSSLKRGLIITSISLAGLLAGVGILTLRRRRGNLSGASASG